jgi:hypothetical protein
LFSDLFKVIDWWHLAQEVIGNVLDDLVHGFTFSTSGVFWSDIHQDINHFVGFFELESKSSILVQTEALWVIIIRKLSDVIKEVADVTLLDVVWSLVQELLLFIFSGILWTW